ncbi:hypothetical protein [Sagittula stellata]|uniref:Uncharacterized protein n=1 Tax=Sagittula stellata (strain ATCC 700073 / DSM 11524 / E-37) TaxID=388399 RepID=A3K958_SAGS3|nr:hypothetical protein [Sagittula stellata]EBA06230.1 hypothetical protein SSE37_15146 [Sagittula stellata E-37]
MKRILTATALVSVIATGAMAQSESSFNANEINTFIPEVNVEMLPDAQVASLMAIISGDGNEESKEREMRAYLGEFKSNNPELEITLYPDGLSDAEVEAMMAYAPGVDVYELTDEQFAELRAVLATNDEEAIKAYIETLQM